MLRKLKGAYESTKHKNTQLLEPPQPGTNADLSRVCENPSTLKLRAFFVY